MDLPATYYGKLDSRNPVISAFDRDIKSFVTLMRRVASSSIQDNGSYAKGIKALVEIWKKYKHRLPPKMYNERMLQIADFLCKMELYQVALWQGYSLHLLQFSSLKITDIKDIDHFIVCFFAEGFDTDQDILTMKIRAMQGCVLCIFEQEKKCSILSQNGLCKLLQLLNFLRIMMQALQQYEHLCWHMYNGSLHIYAICHYLMSMNYSAQALEYLLWASISLELSIPLMTAEYLPWIATLYCAVCYCYYDSQAAPQAEEFARRALGKIHDLARLEEQRDIPATRETQRAYKEASIKLAAMVFKRAVFENRKRPKPIFRTKTKSTLKELPNVAWPRTTTERLLMSLFDSNAACFLGILEALSDSRRSTLQTKMPSERELQEVIMELLSAGISILSGGGSESLSTLISTSTLMDLAIAGENKVPVTSALRFIKLLFQYKQSDAFNSLSKEMLQVLSTLDGQSFRRAELELVLLDSLNSLLCSQRSRGREENISDGRNKSPFLSDEFTGLVETLHKSVCDVIPEMRPDGDLVLDVVLFLWDNMKVVIQRDQLQSPIFTYHNEKWLWCLSVLCEVAFSCDLASVDCMLAAEMARTLAIVLESMAECRHQTQSPILEADNAGINPSAFTLLEKSGTDLYQKMWEVAGWGLAALEKDVGAPIPQDGSAIADSAFMQKGLPLSTPYSCCLTSAGEENDLSKNETEEKDRKAPLDIKSRAKCESLLAKDLHLELVIIHHRASLKLLQLNAVTESDLLNRIKKNKVSKALFLIQKALMVYKNRGAANISSQTKSLLEEASSLVEKAGVEERKLYISNTHKTSAEQEDNGMKENEDNPPPAPILLSRTDHSLAFAPAPYNLEGQVCWYQLCGRTAEGINQKVRIGDCSLLGTGNLVSAVPGECLLKAEGLELNQKYIFAVAAYNSQGKLLGNTIGVTTSPLLASKPLPLLSTWAHLAQVAFQTECYALAKRACKELWSHYTYRSPGSHSSEVRLATTTGLHVQCLQHSSLHLCQLFLTSIFIETEINIQHGSLYCDSFSNSGPFAWEQEARLAECERMLVAMDLALWLNDGGTMLQAVVTCYSLLTPLIFHQITYDPVVQVLTKCLIVLEENSGLLMQNWTGSTSESFMHMVACITYYLSKTLRVLGDAQMASVLLDRGRKLLKEVYDAQLQACSTAVKGETMSPLLKALHYKNKKRFTAEAALRVGNEISCSVTGSEDVLYDLVSDSALNAAYQDVMKLRSKPYFTEFAAQLLQRTMDEGHPDLVLKWGESIFQCLPRHEVVMGSKYLKGESQSEKSVHQKGNETSENKNIPNNANKRKKLKQKMPRSMLQKVRTNREMQVLEKLLAAMTSVVQSHKRRIQHRKMCCEERLWKSQLNFNVAKAHLAVLYRSLDQLHAEDLEHRYSQINPLCFSLAYTGILVWRNKQQEQPCKSGHVSGRDSFRSSQRKYLATVKEGRKEEEDDDSTSEESSEEDEGSSQNVERLIDIPEYCSALMQASFNTAALHLRRAMVLAHRGSHWTLLQCICQTVWDQSCRISVLSAHFEPPITADQLHNTFTSLLVLSTDLIMDMMCRLGLWSLYDSDLPDEELESNLHFSATLDESTMVDLRWIRTLVFYTLERLHDSAKWESLAHFGLVFNSYTWERYAFVVTPLIVSAQRRLLERISSFGGPAVPQPHHVKTKEATGKEVTYRSYGSCQLLCGWAPLPAQRPTINENAELQNPYSPDFAALKGAEIQLSMSLVRVPLDVEDTLNCYRQAVERRPHCLLVFQYSHMLLLLLQAYTQPRFAAQLHQSQGRSVVKFNPVLSLSPNIETCDLINEDFSTHSAVYRFPVSPNHLPTVIAAYSSSIKYLQDNGHNSLRVVALHEMGNLQFYNEDTKSVSVGLTAAQLCWSKAIDCALQSSRAVEEWNGMSIGGRSMEQTLKQAGIWGCLHAAGLTAKIAQYILTSDVSQRTKYCLLSAHLFKCVLCCSMAQPQADLQYAYHSIGEELLPGIDIFSEPHRVHLGTTVTSLHFTCHWLFTTGYYMTLLPVLALYLHFVGTVCRDVRRTVEGKILKIRALTELWLFTEAVKESVQLTQGTGILLPHGQYIKSHQPRKTFYSNKSLQDNAEALEELVNCDFTPDVRTLYGPTLCLRFDLARVQLVLALCNTVHGPPMSGSAEDNTCDSMTSCSVKLNEPAMEDSGPTTEEPKVLILDTEKEKLPLERIKFLLLEGASSLLDATSKQLTPQSCSETENLELTIESNLLRANLYLQQGQWALSHEMAVSSLELLQTSPVIMSRNTSDSGKCRTEFSNTRTRCDQLGDSFRAVEASERIGVHLWLRCRLALFRSLAAHISGTAALLPGKSEKAVRVLKEGLPECRRCGELDIQALLMLEAADLEARRGKTDDSMVMLQETINLVSGRTCMPHASTLTLARAILLLRDLKGGQSTALLKLLQKLFTDELRVFGQSVSLEDGQLSFFPPEPSNIYLPYITILNDATLRILK